MDGAGSGAPVDGEGPSEQGHLGRDLDGRTGLAAL